ncbi:MAG: S8 family serine peptidase [Actinobacteria bacterium]|nr:S8 family serine peptidase [Actinomycetota bacterium]
MPLILPLLLIFISGFTLNHYTIYKVHDEDNNVGSSKSSQAWNLELINLGESWEITDGNSEIKIAVIGYGMDILHPYLMNRIAYSHDFINDSKSFGDENGHDTYAAGIILSIAPDVSLITAKVLDGDSQDYGKIDEAIRVSADIGANIILLPIAVLKPEPDRDYINAAQAAINYAYSKNVRFIIGAQGTGKSMSYRFPGYLNGVYNIAGTDRCEKHSFKSTVSDLNFISAPCEEIPSIDTIGDWESHYGTSWSSSHVAGVVGLMLSANPYLSRSEIEDILRENTRRLGVLGHDNYFGYGMVDCYKSVRAARDLLYADIFKLSIMNPFYDYNFYYQEAVHNTKNLIEQKAHLILYP